MSGQEGERGSGQAGARVAAGLTPGTYEVETFAHAGFIKVAVTVSEDRIEAIEFMGTTPGTNEVIPPLDVDPFAVYCIGMLDEVPQILDTVTDRLGERIIEHQSLNVDAICGATATSLRYTEAVRKALEMAGGNLGAFDVEIPRKTDSRSYDVDVVVVGGGASGITAAANATSHGAKVLLMEKSSRLGGCGSMSTGVRCANSRLQDATEGADKNRVEFADAAKQGLWYPKAMMIRQFHEYGGKTMDYLMDVGGFEFVVSPEGLGYAQDSIVHSMAYDSWRRVASTADTILEETTATGLITDASGAVTGVTAKTWDGTSITVHAKAVVIATGGFMGNDEMQIEYNGSTHSPRFALLQNVGEGLKMMWGIGARKYHIGGMNTHITQPTGHIFLFDFDDYTEMIPYTLHAAPSILRVNGRGERFSSETLLEEDMTLNGNAIVAQGRYFYTIVSQEQMDQLAKGGLVASGVSTPVFAVNFNFYPLPIDYPMARINEAMEAGVESGFITKGDTLEELAQATGFDPQTFAFHVARYEKACKDKVDDLYYKDPSLLFPLGAGPYYAIQNESCPYSTMGGVEVDEQMRVLDTSSRPIPGLYSAGCEAIGVLYNGAAYSDLGGYPLGWACFSGYAAGASAAGSPIIGGLLD
jgi:fumarate reductase flavoprotein subunit